MTDERPFTRLPTTEDHGCRVTAHPHIGQHVFREPVQPGERCGCGRVVWSIELAALPPRPSRAGVLAQLRALAGADPERAHLEADRALLDYLADPEIRAAYEALDRWYA